MFRKQYIVNWLVMIVVGLSCGRGLLGQEPDEVILALDGRVSQFLDFVSMGETKRAYQELLAGSSLLKRTEALKSQIEKTNELETRYGRYRAFERIAAHRVGSDLVLLRYLYKCEQFPVVWYFAFYRTPQGDTPVKEGNQWRVIVVRFDTNLEQLCTCARKIPTP